MSNPISPTTPAEYFKTLVEQASKCQQVQASEPTEFYLVNMLCKFVRPSSRIAYNDDSSQALALRLVRALECDSFERRERLRNLGDYSLFVSGFFSDSFRRSLVDLDYYVAMGRYAYGTLAQSPHEAFSEEFAELAQKFVGFVDVLTYVSEQTTLMSRKLHKLLRRGFGTNIH